MKKILQNRWLWLIVRLLLGGLFVLTGIAKMIDVNGFVEEVIGYGLVPTNLARLGGWALPWVELYIGCSLLLGVFPRLTAAAIIPLSVTFGFAGVYAMLNSSGIICGCLGTLARISHPVSLTIDGVMLAMSLVIITQKEKPVLMLGQGFDRINPNLRVNRIVWFNASLVATVVLLMTVATGIVFVLTRFGT